MVAPGQVNDVRGRPYEKWIVIYINTHFGQFGLSAFNQVTFGRHSLGLPDKNDIFVTNKDGSRFLLIECKTQDVPGSKDEGMVHAIETAESDTNRALIYRGQKFSRGIWNRFLQSRSCWYCSPHKGNDGQPIRYCTANKLRQGEPEEGDTWELDHLLFMHFGLINDWKKDPTWRDNT